MQSGEKPRVAMIGLGYIGLPTAAVIARSGCRVFGVDTSPFVVDTLNRGEVHIQETDLEALVSQVVANGMFTAALTPEPADVFVIAVPTPTRGTDHLPDTRLVMAAGESLAPCLKHGDTIVLESTSPVGTTERLRDRLAALRPDLRFPFEHDAVEADVAIAYCPERVLPGKILSELVSNDRVIGGITPSCARQARTFYEGFVEGACIAAGVREAEMTKLVENSFRDVNIAFANELSMVAETLDIDVWNVIRLANRHPRVNILQPGPGVGGHCIAVDPWFIVHSAPQNTRLIRMAREVNLAKTDHVKARIDALMRETTGPVALLGLAFKPDIDDFRESPALEIAIGVACQHGSRVLICEPYLSELGAELATSGARLVSLDVALKDSETLVLLVDHKEFLGIEYTSLAHKRVYDTRGAWHRHVN